MELQRRVCLQLGFNPPAFFFTWGNDDALSLLHSNQTMALLLSLGCNRVLHRRSATLFLLPRGPTVKNAVARAFSASGDSADFREGHRQGAAQAAPLSAEEEIRRIRNIGIIAHIDAGQDHDYRAHLVPHGEDHATGMLQSQIPYSTNDRYWVQLGERLLRVLCRSQLVLHSRPKRAAALVMSPDC